MCEDIKRLENFLDRDSYKDDFGRDRSWDIVYNDFENSICIDYLARSLTIYLASWGMMRGSSKLLQKYNYKVHCDLIPILLESKEEIKDVPETKNEIEKYVQNVCELIQKIKDHYSKNEVSATDTLISKILLGAFGATPAYDTNFCKYLKEKNFVQKLGKKSLSQVWDLYFEINDDNTEKYKKYKKNKKYPAMKIMDMIGFQYGSENK